MLKFSLNIELNDLSTRVYFRSPILSRLFSIRFVVVVVCLTRAIKNGNHLLSLITPRQHAVEKPLLVVLSGAKSLRVNFCLRSHFRDFLSCFFVKALGWTRNLCIFSLKGFYFVTFLFISWETNWMVKRKPWCVWTPAKFEPINECSLLIFLNFDLNFFNFLRHDNKSL